jgi:hypothetical protein
MHEHFTKLRQNLELNQTLDELVQARHAAVRRAVPGKESKLIGSFQRKTKIQPRPEDELDVDILIVLGEFHRWVETSSRE